MYCVQCSQLYTITVWPFRDTKAYFRLTLFCRNGLRLFYRAKWENNDENTVNDDGENIFKGKSLTTRKPRKLLTISWIETDFVCLDMRV